MSIIAMDSVIDDYREVVGDEKIEKLHTEAEKLSGKHIVNVNSAPMKGGVAEILDSIIPLLNELGVEVGWRILKGSKDFYRVTKGIHNALHGGEINLTDIKKEIYLHWNELNSKIDHFEKHDCVVIHDPQPLPRIKFHKKPKNQKWVWRCHVELAVPNPVVLNYLKQFVNQYDWMVTTRKNHEKEFSIPVTQIRPSIDPLSPKNMELEEKIISKYLHRTGIGREKPIITQVSRFDKWKDPLGVIDVYRKVKKEVDCTLVLIGSIASDDPEGPEMYKKVEREARKDRDIRVIADAHDILVNTMQRVSDVVLQKSLHEGFALTVSEALWKGTPVVGTRTGGISLQINDGENGFLIENNRECVDRIVKLLKDDKLRNKMGGKAKDSVREKFLITRHLMDWIKLYQKLLL